MPKIILSIDEYSVVSWDSYIVVTLFSHLQTHHLTLLDQCFKKKELFKNTPTVIDCVRLSELSLREQDFFLNLGESVQNHVFLSNLALNEFLKRNALYDRLAIAMDFKAALQKFRLNYQHKLDANVVNSFVSCTVKVFSAQTGDIIQIGRPQAQKQPALLDLFGMVPISSTQTSGLFLLSFSSDNLRTIYLDIFKHQAEDIKCELEAFLSEVLEMIHETARSELKNKGFVFYPSSPTVIKRAVLTKHLSDQQIFLNLPVQLKNRTFQICIGIDESP